MNDHIDTQNSSPETTENQEQAALVKELENHKAHTQEWKDKYFRVMADFDNYKKRQEKERIRWDSLAQISLIKDLLPVIDNFERAMVETSDEAKQSPWFKGFELIAKDFKKYLDSIGVQEISITQGFDPSLHEAIMQTASDVHQSGDIVNVLQKGYIFKDTVIRPAQVSVAQ